MFCKDDRCERVGHYHPLVETRGFKMLDVIGSQCIMILVKTQILSEKSVLKFPERNGTCLIRPKLCKSYKLLQSYL